MHNDFHKAVHLFNHRIPTVAKGLLVGLCAGIVTILYRLALTEAEAMSFHLYTHVRLNHHLILPLFVFLGVLGRGMGRLVKRYPCIGGSGIPQVKGQLTGHYHMPWFSTLIAKFFGGILTVFAGLSVGREGPSIQLGALTANGLGDRISTTRTERKILMASGASAGLAAAFNAPLAGVIFAIEEVFKYISPSVLLATMTSAMAADFLSKQVFGLEPIFRFEIFNAIPLHLYPLVVLLGLLTGLFGALYNRLLVKSVVFFKAIAAKFQSSGYVAVFLVAGMAGLGFPVILGSGHRIIEVLGQHQSLKWLLMVFILKFLFSMISFGSGSPGGIFFPLLVLGALLGGGFANLTALWWGVDPDLFFNFVILAMAGYFSAIVRAPITGIVLLTEMTGSLSHLLSLTIISIVAYVVADLLKSPPVYESLLEINLEHAPHKSPDEEKDLYRKLIIETVVHHGSVIEGKTIRDLGLPKGALVISIRRNARDHTPSGDSTIEAEDYLVVLTNLREEGRIRARLDAMTRSH